MKSKLIFLSSITVFFLLIISRQTFSSSFGGDAGLTYNKTTNFLTVTGGGITLSSSTINKLTLTAPATAAAKNAQGQYSGGFGAINLTVSGPNTAPTGTSNNVVGQLFAQPRSGTLIGRISF